MRHLYTRTTLWLWLLSTCCQPSHLLLWPQLHAHTTSAGPLTAVTVFCRVLQQPEAASLLRSCKAVSECGTAWRSSWPKVMKAPRKRMLLRVKQQSNAGNEVQAFVVPVILSRYLMFCQVRVRPTPHNGYRILLLQKGRTYSTSNQQLCAQ
ncbi:hypothetical protein COO60DRAFT_839469 [Scenedesmus sp. NREL 46B-D3]|nr:hypothetical protein COO60DRAFT_839469 [Scenedesmus sp. NREL 46B-D3]